jgi:DNA polymerase-4
VPDRSPPIRAAFHSLPGDGAGGLGLRSLFLDLNAYFASVEQQHNPELRGRPVAVAPVLADAGCCVAASYEAKAMGVKTGMRCGEARRLCPDITIVKTRHRAYIEVHHKIIEAVETCLPVEQVMSIDEMACRLSRHDQTAESARALGEKVKLAIATRVGECLRCSVGIAPNRFLAKVATDMQKPDGLVLLTLADLPHALYKLRLQDLAGIGPRMAKRLESCGINSVRELCSRSEIDLEQAWGGVVGRYWYRWLRGEETASRPTRRRSIGHQHVLGPESRNTQDAWAICVRLLHKAASRMRSLDYFAQKLSLSLKFTDESGRLGRGTGWGAQPESAQERVSRYWSDYENLEGGKQDIMTLTERLGKLWARRRSGTPAFVGVTLHDMLPVASVTAPLFPQDRRREELSRLIDELDEKHGPLTVYTAAMHEARTKAVGGIAFRHVPDLELPDTVV